MGERLDVVAESASHRAIPPNLYQWESVAGPARKRNPHQWESASVPSTLNQYTSETSETGFIALVLPGEVVHILPNRFQVFFQGNSIHWQTCQSLPRANYSALSLSEWMLYDN